MWPGESKLRALYLKGNQLNSLVNESLASLKNLEYLNIQDLPIDDMDVSHPLICIFQLLKINQSSNYVVEHVV